jgi:AcrR family transcriptional regulator
MRVKSRTPKQTRAIETKERIISAAKRLFHNGDFSRITSNAIAAEAGVPIGSFYAYFEGKTQLFKEILDEYYKRILDLKPETWFRDLRNEDPRNRIEKIMKQILKLVESELFRIYEARFLIEKEVRDISKDFRKKLVSALIKSLESSALPLRQADLKTASIVVMTLFEAMINAALFRETGLGKENFIKASADCVAIYLFGS